MMADYGSRHHPVSKHNCLRNGAYKTSTAAPRNPISQLTDDVDQEAMESWSDFDEEEMREYSEFLNPKKLTIPKFAQTTIRPVGPHNKSKLELDIQRTTSKNSVEQLPMTAVLIRWHAGHKPLVYLSKEDVYDVMSYFGPRTLR